MSKREDLEADRELRDAWFSEGETQVGGDDLPMPAPVDPGVEAPTRVGDSPRPAPAVHASVPTPSVFLEIDMAVVPPLPALPEEALSAPIRGRAPSPKKPPEDADRWQAAIAAYEREAKAIGNKPAAAALYLEIGRIWEEKLGKQKNAAMCYQRAFHLDKTDLSVLHAARRLFTDVDNAGMIVNILQAEIDATTDAQRKATLMAEKATLLAERLHNPTEADKTFREALEVWAAEPLALHSLEQLHLSRGEYEALYGVYLRAIAVAQTDERRLPLAVAAAQLAEDHLEDSSKAIDHYSAVLVIDERNALALAALRRLFAVASRFEELVAILERSAAVDESHKRATTFLVSASKVELDELKAPDRALVSMLKALEHSPEDMVLLREIEWLYEANERYEDVAKVLEREAEIVTSPTERVPVLVRLASVLEERLERPDDAAPLYAEAVGLAPEYLPARQALGRLYERTAQWAELAKLYETELAAETNDLARGRLLFKLADLLATRLGRTDDAIERLQALLAVQRDYTPAIRTLERLLIDGQRHDALIELHERELGLATDADQRIYLLSRIARLEEDALAAPERALATYDRILEISSTHLEAIRAVARLSHKLQKFEGVIRAYDLEVDATTDQNEVVSILYKKGVLYEERLGDLDAARASYEKVLSVAPTYLPALRSLGRLLHQQSRFEDLISMYRREIDAVSDDEHAVSLLFRVAELYTDRLDDEASAIETYEAIVERSPANSPAMNALAQIYARRGDYEQLEGVLGRQAEAIDDPGQKAQLLQAVAELCEHELARPDRAAEIFQQMLRLGVGQETAVEGLVRIFSAAGLWSALGLALRSAANVAEDPATKAAVLVRCAEVYADRLAKRDTAADLLEEALAIRPNDPTILTHLERIYITQQAWEKAIETSSRLASLEKDDALNAARHVRIAAMLESKLDPPRSGAAHYYKALERVPSHPSALRGLELAYRRAKAWAGLVTLYRREALVSSDPKQRAGLLFRAGDLAEHELKDDSLADACYTEALVIESGHLPAVEGRRRIGDRRGDAKTSLEMIALEAEVASDPERGVQLLFESGRLYQDEVEDMDAARNAFERVLARKPGHTGASERLEKLHRERGDWKGVVDLLITRAATSSKPEEQAELFLAAAHVAQDKLQNGALAIELFKKVLGREPSNLTALTRLGPLLVEAKLYDEAIEVFHTIVSSSAEPSTLASAFRALGALYEEQQNDLVKAVQSYQAAFSADPKDAESLTRLADVYRGAQDWASAVNVLLRLVDVQPEDADKVATLIELGGIYHQSIDDPENAVRAYTKALEIDRRTVEANVALLELYESLENFDGMAEVSDAFLRSVKDDPERAVPLHLKMADVYERRLKDDDKASDQLRSVLANEPDHPAALEALARLYAKSDATYPQAVDIHRRLLRIDPFRIESYHQIRRMFEQRSEFDKAFVVCEILVFLRAQLPEEDLFYTEFRDKVAPHAAGALSGDEHERWVVHPSELGAARRVFEILVPEIGRVFASDFARYDLNPRSDKHGSRSDLVIRRTCDELAAALGAPEFDLWITNKFETDLFIDSGDTPALVVGHQFDRSKREAEKRFLLGRALEGLKGGHFLFTLLEPNGLKDLVFAAAKAVNPNLPEASSPGVDTVSRRLGKALTRKVVRALKDQSDRVSKITFDPATHVAAAVHTQNRAGLVVTNDIGEAVRAIARETGLRPVFANADGAKEAIGNSDQVRELLSYAISEAYFAARAKLGFSIQS